VISLVRDRLTSSTRVHPAGKVLATPDDVLGGLLFLTTGEVVVELLGANARTLQVMTARAPDVLAPVYGSSRAGVPVMIRCKTDCSVSELPRPDFHQLLQTDERFLELFLDLVSQRISRLTAKIAFLNFHTIRRKLAWYLLSLPEQNQWVRLPRSVTELAVFFGVERPSLSKVLGDYCREGLIEKSGQRDLRITDRSALVAEVG
jgi:CRP-like cAMP-binding protein